MTLFEKCIEVVLRNEGGYVNDPSDPGGETNFGITKAEYPDIDIKNLKKDQAVNIYKMDFWDKMNLEGIEDELLVLQVFDMGVNAGIRTSIKMIQRLAGAYPDGICGPITKNLINASNQNLVELFKTERKKYYSALVRKNLKLNRFLQGWFNRVDNTKF